MLTDEELLLRLTDFEDSFVERKTSGDTRDWITATVAFANSAPLEFPCVLFIGAKDDGTIEKGVNFDSLQKTYTKLMKEVYPPVPTYSRLVKRDGLSCLAIIVLGSQDRPHFPCHALKRVKSETTNATDADVRRMLEERDSKTYYLLQWVGKQITVDKLNVERVRPMGPIGNSFVGMLSECNRFWLTVDHDSTRESIPLRRTSLSFDHGRNQLKIEVLPY